jgi:hypothetical protein
MPPLFHKCLALLSFAREGLLMTGRSTLRPYKMDGLLFK